MTEKEELQNKILELQKEIESSKVKLKKLEFEHKTFKDKEWIYNQISHYLAPTIGSCKTNNVYAKRETLIMIHDTLTNNFQFSFSNVFLEYIKYFGLRDEKIEDIIKHFKEKCKEVLEKEFHFTVNEVFIINKNFINIW